MQSSIPQLQDRLTQLKVDSQYAEQACKNAFESARDLRERKADGERIRAVEQQRAQHEADAEHLESQIKRVQAEINTALEAQRAEQARAALAARLEALVAAPGDISSARAALTAAEFERDGVQSLIASKHSDISTLEAKRTRAVEAEAAAKRQEAIDLAEGRDPKPRAALANYDGALELLRDQLDDLESRLPSDQQVVDSAARSVATGVYQKAMVQVHAALQGVPDLIQVALHARKRAGLNSSRTGWDEFYSINLGDNGYKAWIASEPIDASTAFEALAKS